MSNPIIDRSAPGVRITLLPDEKAQSGEPLELGDRIIGFTFEDSEKKADKLALQLDNFDLSLFEMEELAGGATFEVSWGYPGNMAPTRRVVVKKLKGFTTLTLEGRATSVLMDRESKTRAWEGKTRSQVAEEIAKEHGFEGTFLDLEETQEAFDVINQTGETDARFLRRLAAREEFEFFVDDGGFHFRERQQSATPTHTFTWYSDPGRGDVMAVNVESDLTKRVGKVTVRSRDPVEEFAQRTGDALFVDGAHVEIEHVGFDKRGLFLGVELVVDRTTKEAPAAELGLAKKLRLAAMEQGLICYPAGGTADGRNGVHVLLAPPFIYTRAHAEELTARLVRALAGVRIS